MNMQSEGYKVIKGKIFSWRKRRKEMHDWDSLRIA